MTTPALAVMPDLPDDPEYLDSLEEPAGGNGARGATPAQRNRVAEALSPLLIRADELLKHPELLTAPVSVIPGLAWQGRVTLFASREKAGKSTTLAAGVAALTRGHAFLGERVERGRALYWSADRESLADQVTRLRRFGADLAGVDLVLRPPVNLEELTLHIAGHSVVVVDTLASASQDVTDAFSSSQWVPLLLRYVDMARRSGCAVILVHHANRTTGKYRDSTSIGATVDVIVEMAPGADPDTRELATVARWPSLAKRSFRLAGTPDAAWLEVVGNLRPQLDARLLAAIEAVPGLTATDYQKRLQSRKDDVLEGIARLAHEGTIQNTGSAARPRWERANGSAVPDGSGNLRCVGDRTVPAPLGAEPIGTATGPDEQLTIDGNRSEEAPRCQIHGVEMTWVAGVWGCDVCVREAA